MELCLKRVDAASSLGSVLGVIVKFAVAGARCWFAQRRIRIEVEWSKR